MKKLIHLIVFALLINQALKASDIIEIVPITNQILALHLDDGYAVYHKKGQARSNERVVVELLNVDKAEMISNYSILSNTDATYFPAKQPKEIGRKTKGTEFTWMCQSWNNGCINTAPDHVKEHWIFLYLPEPLQNNTEYIINTKDIANNGENWKFQYNDKVLCSPAIHANLIGYKTNSPAKYAYIYYWMGNKGGADFSAYANQKFYLVDHFTNETVFQGKIKFRKAKNNIETGQPTDSPDANFLGSDVYECDFSSFSLPGKYRLVVENMGCSNPFKIGDNIYQQVFFTTIRGLYHNRSGIELKEPYTDFVRPAPHNPLLTNGFEGKLKYTTSRFIDWTNGDNSTADKSAIENGILGSIDSWGWYQDAGDWDGYYTHLNIPTILLFSWQIAPENYIDNQLNLPESGNDIPDILDEAAWLLRYFQRTRQLILNNGYGTGGIGGRVCGDHFGGDGEGIPSYEDVNRIYVVSGGDPHTTYKYAGLAAQMAFCLNTLGKSDPDSIDWENEAVEAYQWAQNNTLAGDENPKPAMPDKLKDFRAFAATSLFQLTGELKYRQQFETDLATLSSFAILAGEQRWAPFVLANLPENLEINETLKNKAKQAIVYTANSQVNAANKRACRWGGEFNLPMLIGQPTTPLIFEIIMAYHLVKNDESNLANSFLSVIHTTADYFLGSNPLNTTWITGLGIKHPERVFHMDSWYNGKDEMAPGITPYGPWRDEKSFTGQGAWDVAWSYKSIFPEEITTWPGHERWFGNYTSPLNAEFTVHQNTIYNAAVYGFLSGPANPEFKENKKPKIEEFKVKRNNYGVLVLKADVSDPDGSNTIHKVEFYNDWHKIGETKKSPYEIEFIPGKNESIKIKSKVIDELGAYSYSDVKNESDIITTVSNNKKQSAVLVYPNPFNNEVTFLIKEKMRGNVTLEIYEQTGKLIYNCTLNSYNLLDNRITWHPESKNLVEGIYHYSFSSSNGNGLEKMSGNLVFKR